MAPPTTASTSSAGVASSSTSLSLSTRKPPALMMPACSSAETGVGVSITSISQPCTGNWADFNRPAKTISTAAIWTPSGIAPCPRIAWAAENMLS